MVKGIGGQELNPITDCLERRNESCNRAGEKEVGTNSGSKTVYDSVIQSQVGSRFMMNDETDRHKDKHKYTHAYRYIHTHTSIHTYSHTDMQTHKITQSHLRLSYRIKTKSNRQAGTRKQTKQTHTDTHTDTKIEKNLINQASTIEVQMLINERLIPPVPAFPPPGT